MRVLLVGLLNAPMLSACFDDSVEEQAAKLGTKEFIARQWAHANQEERGKMLASLLAKHDFKGRSAGEVQSLLGRPTGYVDYDEDPAYLVGSESVYQLVFVTDKSNGHVAEVRIVPEVKKR